MKDGVLIVGAGHAGVQAAASLREEGFEGPVTLIGEENALPYHKPPLSKTFLKEPDAKPQPLRGESFYDGHRIDLRLGQRVVRVDPAARLAELANGGTVAFDALILATGSRPRPLRLSDTPYDNVASLRSLADAEHIRDLAAATADAVVIGGGFIGLEMAATLAAKGHRVSVIEAQDRILGRAVSSVISQHVQRRLEATGVRFLLNTTITGLKAHAGRVAAVVTSAGETIAAGMVIVGIGVVPDVEIGERAGLGLDNGIALDAAMRSSVPQILAIGDNASYPHWQVGRRVRLESVQNATDQAKLAARTILGHAADYRAVPWFWSDIGDMKLQMVGLTGASDRHVVTGEPDQNRFCVYHFAGDRLMSIDTVNRPGDHMLGRKMIGAGFSPAPAQAEAGPDALKAALASFETSHSAQP
ncbi:MAG: FAD-dependent oxidoreductase [Rhizobiaceae bacterium]|nr:FAD-dependent oxidoreductase [Rhizobiaceae bacterium]